MARCRSATFALVWAALLLQLARGSPVSCTFESLSTDCTLEPPFDGMEWKTITMSQASGDIPLSPDATDNPYAYLYTDASTLTSGVGLITTHWLETSDDSSCVSFNLYNVGVRLAKFQVVRECNTTDEQSDVVGSNVIWQNNGYTSRIDRWKKEVVKLRPDGKPIDKCRLLFRAEATAAGEMRGGLGLDDIKTGSCDQLMKPIDGICDWEDRCDQWTPAEISLGNSFVDEDLEKTATVQWRVSQMADSHDHTYHSSEGHVLRMNAEYNGCSAARLIGQFSAVDRYTDCFSMAAQVFSTSDDTYPRSAEILIHIVNFTSDDTFIFLDTPWRQVLDVAPEEENHWSLLYAHIDATVAKDMSLFIAGDYRYIIEARICSDSGGGIAIDDLYHLSKTGETCRIPGDEHFDFSYFAPNFWQSTYVSITKNNWIPVSAQ